MNLNWVESFLELYRNSVLAWLAHDFDLFWFPDF